MDILISAARWLAFLPSALAAYVVTTWLVFYGVSYGAPEAASAVRYAADFAGYYLLGPAIVFMWFSVATAMAVYAGISVAPSAKKVAAGILGLIVIAFIGMAIAGIVASPDRDLITWQMWARTLTEMVGMIAGLGAGIALANEGGAFVDDRAETDPPFKV